MTKAIVFDILFQKRGKMSTLLKPLLVREKLLEGRLRLFTGVEFVRLFPGSQDKVKYFLERQTKLGLFVRLKKGLYMLKTDPAGETEIANRLYQPSYISFEYALADYNILPEMPYAVTSATTKPTRVFPFDHKDFSYLSIKKTAFTGYWPLKKDNRIILMAGPEKALADYLYFVVLGKKPMNERLDLLKINRKKLLSYCRLFKRQKLVQIAKTL